MTKCDICGKEFVSPRGIGGHKALKHSDLLARIVKERTLKRAEVTKKCEKCGKEFNVIRRVHKDGTFYIDKKEKTFCSRSCANSHTQTKEQNKKRSEKLIGKPTWIKGRVFKEGFYCKVCGKRLSHNCKRMKCLKCTQAEMGELIKYRYKCVFKFNLYDYPNEFNLNLIEEKGLYSASNRGNNLNGVSRDHMISIKYGWENNIPPEVISHPANCQLLEHRKNCKKNSKCSLTIEELNNKIKEWDIRYPLVANQQTR